MAREARVRGGVLPYGLRRNHRGQKDPPGPQLSGNFINFWHGQTFSTFRVLQTGSALDASSRLGSVGQDEHDHGGSEESHSPDSSGASSSSDQPSKPVLRKHGKLISFFRSFILSRPARGKLKKSGILKERVFGCDLSEHLLNTGQEGIRIT